MALIRRTPLRKQKKGSPARFKRLCDKEMGRIIRSKGRCDFWHTLFGCSPQLQWAHIKSRRFRIIRHDPQNSLCLCAAHHRWGHDHPDLFVKRVEELFPGRLDYLNKRMIDVEKIDYKSLYEELKTQ